MVSVAKAPASLDAARKAPMLLLADCVTCSCCARSLPKKWDEHRASGLGATGVHGAKVY